MMSIPEECFLRLLDEARREGRLQMLQRVARLLSRDLAELNRLLDDEVTGVDAAPGPARPRLVR